jgi:hypothetical protein
LRFFGFKKKEPSAAAAPNRKRTDAPSLHHLNRLFQGSASSGAVRFEDGFETGIWFDWKKISAAVQAAIQRDATYSDLVVSKKGGGLRYISIPGRHTAAIQRQLLSKVDSQDYVNPHAYAYIPGRSVVECAEQHAQAKWLIKVDLRDFFHFIDEKMVYLEFRRRGGLSHAAPDLRTKATTRFHRNIRGIAGALLGLRDGRNQTTDLGTFPKARQPAVPYQTWFAIDWTKT